MKDIKTFIHIYFFSGFHFFFSLGHIYVYKAAEKKSWGIKERSARASTPWCRPWIQWSSAMCAYNVHAGKIHPILFISFCIPTNPMVNLLHFVYIICPYLASKRAHHQPLTPSCTVRAFICRKKFFFFERKKDNNK